MQKLFDDFISSFKIMFNTKEYMASADFNADDYVKAAQIRRQRTNLQRSAFVAMFLIVVGILLTILVSILHMHTKLTIASLVVTLLLLVGYIVIISLVYPLPDEAYESKFKRIQISSIYCSFWAVYGTIIALIPNILGRGDKDRILCTVLLFILLTVPIFTKKEALSLVPIGIVDSIIYITSETISFTWVDLAVFLLVIGYLLSGSQINQMERIESYYQTARNRAEFHETKRRLGKIFEEVFDFAFEFDTGGYTCDILRANDDYDGLTEGKISMTKFLDNTLLLAHPDDSAICEKNFDLDFLKNEFYLGRSQVYFEARFKNKEGDYKWSSVMITKESDNSQGEFILCLVQDIEERKRNENKLKLEAENDPLTQIYNKVTTKSMIEECLENNSSSQHALMIMDIDNFKTINDTRGHATGDQILLAFAAELNKNFRETDIIGRAGGDEFIVLMKNVQSVALVCDKLQRLTSSFKKYGINHGIPGRLSTSIGVALYNKDGKTYEELFKRADAALYEAKKNGKDQYKFSISNV